MGGEYNDKLDIIIMLLAFVATLLIVLILVEAEIIG